jgi:hypothetical protein
MRLQIVSKDFVVRKHSLPCLLVLVACLELHGLLNFSIAFSSQLLTGADLAVICWKKRDHFSKYGKYGSIYFECITTAKEINTMNSKEIYMMNRRYLPRKYQPWQNSKKWKFLFIERQTTTFIKRRVLYMTMIPIYQPWFPKTKHSGSSINAAYYCIGKR